MVGLVQSKTRDPGVRSRACLRLVGFEINGDHLDQPPNADDRNCG